MDLPGLALCARFAFPPNSLSLCGPSASFRQHDLRWYAQEQKLTKGTEELLSQFSTLFPYLCLIAKEARLNDAFNLKVVEAYWIGNNLTGMIKISNFVELLDLSLNLKKKIGKKDLVKINDKIALGATPHHSFHVLNIYKRTGYLDIPHTLATMDACLINWGKVVEIKNHLLTIETQPLVIKNDKLLFGTKIQRKIRSQGDNDILFSKLNLGDRISYHWGYFCQKLSGNQLQNLVYYTNLSLKFANIY